MCEVLTKSGLSFMYKMIREIISMPRADLGNPHNFMVNSWVFKEDESEFDAEKTNSRHRACLLLVGSPLLTCRVHAQSPLLARARTHTHICPPVELILFLVYVWVMHTPINDEYIAPDLFLLVMTSLFTF